MRRTSNFCWVDSVVSSFSFSSYGVVLSVRSSMGQTRGSLVIDLASLQDPPPRPVCLFPPPGRRHLLSSSRSSLFFSPPYSSPFFALGVVLDTFSLYTSPLFLFASSSYRMSHTERPNPQPALLSIHLPFLYVLRFLLSTD